MVVNGKERKATGTVNNGFGAGWFRRLVQPPVTPICIAGGERYQGRTRYVHVVLVSKISHLVSISAMRSVLVRLKNVRSKWCWWAIRQRLPPRNVAYHIIFRGPTALKSKETHICYCIPMWYIFDILYWYRTLISTLTTQATRNGSPCWGKQWVRETPGVLHIRPAGAMLCMLDCYAVRTFTKFLLPRWSPVTASAPTPLQRLHSTKSKGFYVVRPW